MAEQLKYIWVEAKEFMDRCKTAKDDECIFCRDEGLVKGFHCGELIVRPDTKEVDND